MNNLMTSGSNAVALPSFVKQRESSLAKAMGGGLSASTPSISLRNSRFHFKKDGNEIGTAETLHLDVILVGASEYIHRAYYDKAYDQESDAKPACTSHKGDKPDGGETKQHDSCKFCPQNKKQPDPRRPGKDYTPCGFSKDIAVMIPGDPSQTVWRLKLSSMTLFNNSSDDNAMSWKALLGKFNAVGADPMHYVVRLAFDTEASVPMLTFSVAGMVGDGTTNYDEAFYNVVMEKVDADVPAEVVGDSAPPVGTVENQAPAPEQMPVQPAPVVPPAATTTPPPVATTTPPPAQQEAPVQTEAPVQAAEQAMNADAGEVNKLLGMFG